MKAGVLPTGWRGEGVEVSASERSRQGRVEGDSGQCPLSLATPSIPPGLAVLVCEGCANSITRWLPPQNPDHSLETRSWPSVQVGAWLGFSEGTRKIQPHDPVPASGGWPAPVAIFSGGSAGIALAAGLSTPTSGFTVSWRSLCVLVCV